MNLNHDDYEFIIRMFHSTSIIETKLLEHQIREKCFEVRLVVVVTAEVGSCLLTGR